LLHLAHRTAVETHGVEETYFWHDDHMALFLRRDPDKTDFHVVLVNVLTGHETIPGAFNKLNSPLMQGMPMMQRFQGSSKDVMHYFPPECSMSPDNRWLLWNSKPSPYFGNWVAATIGGKQQKWAQGVDPDSNVSFVGGHGLWMPDSKQWVELIQRYSNRTYTIHLARVYEVGRPRPLRTIRITGLQDGLPVGVTYDGLVAMHVGTKHGNAPTAQLDLALVRIDSDSATARPVSIPIPVSYNVADVILSPKGDRLAWVARQGPVAESLHTLYTADADGSHFRSIGSAVGIRTPREFSWPRELRWLPDGKHVSFAYNGALYVVPI
jgi:hypothetical protein